MSNKLTIIGLGCDEGDLSLNALNVINNSQTLVVRTENTLSFNAVKKLNKKVITLDYIYNKSRNFDTLSKNLAKEVLNLSEDRDIVYLVDGSITEDSSVKEILSKKRKDVFLISGVSHGVKCLERLKKVTTNYMCISAYDVFSINDYFTPLVVYAIDSKKIASEIKLILSNYLGEETDVYVATETYTKKIKLYELDRLNEYNYSTSIYIDNLNVINKKRFKFSDLIEIVRRLRSENGCPWDRVQTPKSIEKNLIEETYELLDAIEENDDDKIIEEAGDVLLQVAFYCVFGEEDCRYNYSDVLSNICSKLITRHTHVFGQDSAKNSEEALSSWNKNKAIEKGYKNGFEYVDSVPKNLPSLMFAQKVGSRAGKYNFDFDNYYDVLSKIYEEIEEINLAINTNSTEDIESECGDLLFSTVNAVRKLGVDAETALYKSTKKFINRFKLLEEAILKDGKNIKDLTLEEIDAYYKIIKKEV